jgi:hypothetical protein
MKATALRVGGISVPLNLSSRRNSKTAVIAHFLNHEWWKGRVWWWKYIIVQYIGIQGLPKLKTVVVGMSYEVLGVAMNCAKGEHGCEDC